MDWYVKVVIYLFTVSLTAVAMYQVDFNKFMRIGKKQLSLLVWLVVSLALGYLIGSLFIVLGEQIGNI
ncbi:MAG: hypothetical protein KAG91_00190 [Mycoplasmataceae bacterium]|nr:hypothetical protein [Mycoplasmataceae bacterium]